jgi:hypothetical protein
VNPSSSRFVPLVVIALVTLIAVADGAPHPYHDDNGLIAWRPTWSAAVQEAKATGKPLYIELTHDDEEGAAFVTSTLVNKSIQKVLRRYFVCVVLDFVHKPPELDRLCKAKNLSLTPVNLFLSPSGEYIAAHQKNVNVADFQKTLQTVLATPRLAAAKVKEKELERLTQTLSEALDAKEGNKVQSTFQAIEKVPGISPAKSRAYVVLDEAEEPIWDKLREAGDLVRAQKFPLARVALEEAARISGHLPVGREVQVNLTALPFFEEAGRLEDAKEPRWKEKALQEYQRALFKHPESSLAATAVLHIRRLTKPR